MAAEGKKKKKKKNPEFFGDARSLGSVVPLDKAFIEQEQEWSCRRDPRWLGLPRQQELSKDG